MSDLNGRFEGMLEEESSAPLDDAMNAINDGGLEGIEGLDNGHYDYGIDPQPYYKSPDEGTVGDGSLRKHLGPPQGTTPRAPSHQAIMQQYPGDQPMEYALAREYFEEYADILNPTPTLQEERDYGGTMMSEEENLYRRADGEMSTMKTPQQLETRDPYGRYDELYGPDGKLKNPPTRQLHGLDGPARGVPRSRPLSEQERKTIIAKIAIQRVRQQVPKLAAYFGRRRSPGSFRPGLGLGDWELTNPQGTVSRVTEKPEADWIKSGIEQGWTIREVPPLPTIEGAVANALNVLVPAAIANATSHVALTEATPGGTDYLRTQYITPVPTRAFYEQGWFWGVVAAGATAAFVLPKVMAR